MPGACAACGKNPAEGYASTWTEETGQQWLCHGDAEGPSCYELHSRGRYVDLPFTAEMDCIIAGCRWGDAHSPKCECQ